MPATPNPLHPVSRPPRHIVVLHRDAAMRELARELLTDEQYRVTPITTEEDAAQVIGTLQPDLVFIDLRYQDVVGWAVLVTLTEALLTRDLPVIVTSTDRDLLACARDLHTKHSDRRFLTVPFDVEELVRLVGELIGPA